MLQTRLRGIIPAITSPCDENDMFLEDAFASLAGHLYQQGVHGLYVCGATGEGTNMRLQERKRATEIAVEVSKPFAGTVIVHLGTSNTRDSVELAEHAASAGAHAVASMPPANRSHAELISYYRAVTEAAQLPSFIYHIPHLTGHNLPLRVFCELLDIPGVTGIKFSGSNLFLMKRILLARPGTVIFNGDDELLCPALLYGAAGGIGLTYNLFPRFFVSLYNTVRAGDIVRAMDMQDRFAAFLHRAIEFGTRSVLDLLMRERGFGPFTYRRPRTVLDEAASRKFHDEVDPLMAAVEKGASDG